MDPEVLKETLEALCQNEKHAKYVDYFKQLKFDNVNLVYGKYLHVSPPFPGDGMTDQDKARNIFHMTYNQLYNSKYNIDPYASSSEDEEDEEL